MAELAILINRKVLILILLKMRI